MAASNFKAAGCRGWRLSGGFFAAGLVAAFTLVLQVLCAHAGQNLHGRVVRVTDGDTIVVEDSDRRRHKVRIVSIDAPEKGRRDRAGQPYAERSRQHLALLVETKQVRLVTRGYDDYGRVLASVRVAGAESESEVDVGLAQVCAGYAWLYEMFANTLSPGEQRVYRACQSAARRDKRGLWRADDPIPPWVWRHAGSGAGVR